MVIQAGAGRLATTAAPADASTRLTPIAEAGRQALDDMTRLVDVLGRATHDAAAAIPTLLEQARAAGVDVRLLGAGQRASAKPTGRSCTASCRRARRTRSSTPPAPGSTSR